jgi:Uma2 family endonuclease
MTTKLTGARFDALPYEEARRLELVDGELIPVSTPTPEHQLIVQRILFGLMLYFRDNPDRGLALLNVEFALSENSRMRPDISVLLADRAAALDVTAVPVHGIPDLVIEVISRAEHSGDTQLKMHAFCKLGIREVWQVYPRTKSVVVHRGSTTIMFDGNGNLSTEYLPGLLLNVPSLFD